jgi:hypothetical protein
MTLLGRSFWRVTACSFADNSIGKRLTPFIEPARSFRPDSGGAF